MGKTILSIDDDPVIRTLIEEGLVGAGHTVVTADDGYDGLHKALRGNFDVIICDVMMPTMDGYELCAKLRKHSATKHVPLIILTSKQTVTAETAKILDAAYLAKPFRFAQLQELIARLTASQESPVRR